MRRYIKRSPGVIPIHVHKVALGPGEQKFKSASLFFRLLFMSLTARGRNLCINVYAQFSVGFQTASVFKNSALGRLQTSITSYGTYCACDWDLEYGRALWLRTGSSG